MMKLNSRGYSLSELLIAMVIFGILMTLTSSAFRTVLTQSTSLIKGAESNIEGVVGLEMLRKDVAQIGYGLPWNVQRAYSSVTGMPVTLPVSLTQIQTLNDAPLGAPRAMGSLDNVGYNSSDYLALKSTLVSLSNTVTKTAILRESGIAYTDTDLAKMFAGTETVTVINPTFNPLGQLTNKILITRETFTNASGSFRPRTPNETYIVYGLDDSRNRAPFNRADYFIYRPPDLPEVCAKPADTTPSVLASRGIGNLYKAVMKHANGSMTLYPILDCVADLQVVYGLDLSGDGEVDFHDNILPTDPATIRSQLKEVRLYILAQEGKKDRLYTYPSSTVLVGATYGSTTYGHQFDLSAANIKDWRNYRWKVYTIVVRTNSL
jgi:prepilin-type N-terminal cleavage/methylation domain-containing protein